MPRLQTRCRGPVFLAAGVLLALLTAAAGARAGELLLAPAGSGVWQVTAQGLSGVAAVDLDLRYDAAALPQLKAEAGPLLQGVLTAINEQVPGVLRVAAVATQSLPSAGVVLTLRAAPPAELKVTAFAAKTLDGNGQSLPTQVRWNQAALPSLSLSTEPPAQPKSVASPVYQPASPRGTTVSGSLPGGAPAAAARPVALAPPAALPAADRGHSAPASGPALLRGATLADKRFYTQGSVVAGIQALRPPWTVATVEQVFRTSARAAKVRQEPMVVLADGRTPLQLWIDKGLCRAKPALAVEGCKLVTIVDDGRLGWRVELLTYRGVWPAQLVLLGEEALLRLPLVVVPALTLAQELVGLPPNAPLPALDLNDDGVSDAVDAYLLVGNRLARAR